MRSSQIYYLSAISCNGRNAVNGRCLIVQADIGRFVCRENQGLSPPGSNLGDGLSEKRVESDIDWSPAESLLDGEAASE